MAVIKILDKQTDRIVESLDYEAGDFSYAKVRREINNLSTFDFDAHEGFAALKGRNRVIIQGRTGAWHEFIIRNVTTKDRDTVTVLSDGAYGELRNADPILPRTYAGATPEFMVREILRKTSYEVGEVDFPGNAQTMTFENPLDPYDALTRVANAFDMELRFRVEISGNRIVGRYVDLVTRLDGYRGRKFTYGKDIIGIERVEDTNELVTALLVVGPEPSEEGKERKYVTVTDEDAFIRWGRDGNHIWAIHEPQTEADELSEDRLRTIGRTELNKRNTAAISYEIDVEAYDSFEDDIDQYGDVDLGVTVLAIDEDYNPPLYLEARIVKIEEDYGTSEIDSVTVGDIIEYTEEDVYAQIATLRALLKKKATDAVVRNELAEIERQFEESLGLLEPKIPRQATPPANPKEGDKYVDTSTQPNVLKTYDGTKWVKASPTEAAEIGAETPQGAQDKADAAEGAAKEHADTVAGEAEEAAKGHADEVSAEAERQAKLYAEQQRQDAEEYARTRAAEEKNAAIIAAAADAKAKADAALAAAKKDATEKANAAQAAAIADAQAALEAAETAILEAASSDAASKASAAQAAAIKDAEGKLSTARQELESAIADAESGAAATAIADAESKLADARTALETQIGKKADASTTYTKTEVNTALNGKVSTSTYTTDKNGIINRLDTAETSISQNAEAIESKASQTTVDGIAGRVSKAETTITQHAGAIASKAEQEDLDTVSGVASSAKTTAEQTANALTSKAEKTYVDTVSGVANSAKSLAEQTAEGLKSKVESVTFTNALATKQGEIPKSATEPTTNRDLWLDTSVTPNVLKRWNGSTWVKATPTTAAEVGAYTSSAGTALAGRVSKAETTITQHADKIESKAEQSDLDTVSGVASSAKTTAEQTANALKSKAEVSTVNTLTGRVDTAETTISQHATAISSKAEKSTVDTVSGVANSAKSLAEQTAEGLKSKVESVTFTNALATKQGEIPKSKTAPTANKDLWLDTSVTPNVLKRWNGSTWVKATPTTAAEVGAYSSSAGSALAGRVKTAETTITQHANSIKSKAEQTDLDTVSGVANSAKTTAEQTATALTSKADKSTVDAVAGRVSKAETTITQHANAISSKAEKSYVDTVSGVANSAKSTAEQTAEGLKTKVETSTFNALSKRVGTAESTIEQHADAISSKVDATYVENAVHVSKTPGEYSKTFTDVLISQNRSSNVVGMLIIRTPIVYNAMVNISVAGYNYVTGTTDIDLNIGFYHYSSGILQHGFNSKGTFKIDKVQVGRDASDRAVLMIGDADTRWSYPAITVDKAIIGYTMPPDSYKDGWTADYSTSIPEDVTDVRVIDSFSLKSQIETMSSEISQNAKSISQRVTNTTFNALAGRVSTAEGKITTMAGQISAKAEKTVTDGLTTRMSTAESKISANESAISQRATKSTVNALTTRVSTAEQTISAHDSAIKNKAEISVTNGLNSRLKTAEQTISAHDTSIKSKVSQTDFNALSGRVGTAESAITQSQKAIELRVTQSEFDAFVDQQMNLIRNPATLSTREGWSTGSIETVDFLGTPTKALAVTSSGSTQIYSDYFDVDPSKAYEVTMWLKSQQPAPSSTNAYIGVNAVPSTVEGVYVSSGSTYETSNFYFYSNGGTTHLSDWTKVTGYILPAGFDTEKAKGLGDKASSNVRMKTTTERMRIRFLNWANTSARKMWMTNAYVREVPPNLLAEGVRRDNVVSSINLTPETVKITASKIALDGDVEVVNGKTKVQNFTFDAGQGGTLTLGGENNTFGRLQVLNDEGDTVADLDGQVGGFSELSVGYLHAPNKVEYINFHEVDSVYHVATAWGGDTGVYAEPNDENDGLSWHSPLATIEEAIRRIPHVFDGTVYIRLASNQVFNERINLRGLNGNGTINIECAGKTSMSTINGDFKVGRGGVYVTLERVILNHAANAKMVCECTAGLVRISDCDIRGNSNTTFGVDANYGGFVWVERTKINGCAVGIRAYLGGTVYANANRGRNRTNGIESWAGTVFATGTQPAGDRYNARNNSNGILNASGVTYPDAASTPPPAPPQTRTVSYNSTGGNTYRVTQGYWDTQWSLRNTVAQGRWDSRTGLLQGFWFFGSGPSSAVTGKKIKQIRAYIKRESTGGSGGAVTVTIRSHGYTSRPSGKPSVRSASYSTSLSRGQGKWVTLPSSFISDFKSGGAKGIGVYTSSTSSAYYARLETSAKLEITYEE